MAMMVVYFLNFLKFVLKNIPSYICLHNSSINVTTNVTEKVQWSYVNDGFLSKLLKDVFKLIIFHCMHCVDNIGTVV